MPIGEAKPPGIRAARGGPDPFVDADDLSRLVEPDRGSILVDHGEGLGETLTRFFGCGPERAIEQGVEGWIAVSAVVHAILSNSGGRPRSSNAIRTRRH